MSPSFNDTFYVVGQEYVFQFDVTTWGWMHLLLGILVAFAGFFIFRGAIWARTIGVIVAALSVIVNFAWLPYYPVWSLDHHRARRVRHLGPHRARAGHRRVTPRHSPSSPRVTARCTASLRDETPSFR